MTKTRSRNGLKENSGIQKAQVILQKNPTKHKKPFFASSQLKVFFQVKND